MMNKIKKMNKTAPVFIFFLAVAVRSLYLNRFPISGDEWYSIASAQQIGTSLIGWPYFVLSHFFLDRYGLSIPWMRFISILLGSLGVVVLLWGNASFASKKVGLYAALIAAFSPYLVFDHLEIRYYSLFFLASSLLAAAYLNFTKFPNRFSFMLAVGASLFGMSCHFNLIFTVGGFLCFLFFESVRRQPQKRQFQILCAFFAGLTAAFLLILVFRERIFSVLGELTYAHSSTAMSGKVGWRPTIFLKYLFTLFTYIAGYNANPLRFSFILPIVLLYLLMFYRGIVFLEKTDPLLKKLCLYLIFIPLALLFFLAEPLATAGYKGIVSPKHAVFAYPFFVFVLAAGIASFSGFAQKVFLLILILTSSWGCYKIYNPDYSYYTSRYIDYKQPGHILSRLKGKNLLVLDPHLEKSFLFYNKEILRSAQSQSSWTIINPWMIENDFEFKNYAHVVIALDDWKIFSPKDASMSSRGKYGSVFDSVQASHCIEDGLVQFPFFFYAFQNRTSDNCVNSIPIEPHSFEYADLNLPILASPSNPESRILGGFALNSNSRSDWKSPEWRPLNANLNIIYNLEASQGIADNQKVGWIEIENARGLTKIELIKGKNVFDVFSELEEKMHPPASGQIAYSWIKRPLISSQIRYPGVFREIRAHLYRLIITREEIAGSSSIKIHYSHRMGQLRIWKIFFDDQAV